MPEGAGKVQAIRELVKILNISLDDIVAFGDDINDMEMLKMCGTGVAVANAVPDVKAIADCVTLSNDEDGVAEWIIENVLMGYYLNRWTSQDRPDQIDEGEHIYAKESD